ncbi:MAG: hypothetical protein VW713_04555 [Alphaproteobacteria bacterium]
MSRRVFSDDEVRAILADPRPHREIAAEYGMWVHVVSDMKCRRSYRNVAFTGKIARQPSRKRLQQTPRQMPKERRRVFSDVEVRAILADDRPYRAVAAAHDTWVHVISAMKWRRTYRHVTFEGRIARHPPRKKSRLTI